MLEETEKGLPIAKCHIKHINDEQNVCMLYSNALSIVYKGKKSIYPIKDITEIKVKHKMLLFPIISGGIVGTFFMISAFNFSINIWISLSLSFLGFIALFLGFQGSSTLSITTSIKEFDFFISENKRHITGFCLFIMEYFVSNRNASHIFFYLPASRESWLKAQKKGEFEINQKTLLLTHTEIKTRDILPYLRIDITQFNTQIEMEYNLNNERYVPYLKNSFSIEGIDFINY